MISFMISVVPPKVGTTDVTPGAHFLSIGM
jgi:hypothetical protein